METRDTSYFLPSEILKLLEKILLLFMFEGRGHLMLEERNPLEKYTQLLFGPFGGKEMIHFSREVPFLKKKGSYAMNYVTKIIVLYDRDNCLLRQH